MEITHLLNKLFSNLVLFLGVDFNFLGVSSSHLKGTCKLMQSGLSDGQETLVKFFEPYAIDLTFSLTWGEISRRLLDVDFDQL